MIGEENRVHKRNVLSWDIRVRTNNPESLELLKKIEELITPNFKLNHETLTSNHRIECEDCRFKRATEEILNILSIHKFIEKTSKNRVNKRENSSKRYKIEVK